MHKDDTVSARLARMKATQTEAVERNKIVQDKNAAKRMKGNSRTIVLNRLFKAWQAGFKKSCPDLIGGKWGPKERGMMDNVLMRYGYDEALITRGINFYFNNWPKLNERWFKGEAISPSMAIFTKLIEQILNEATQVERLLAIRDEVKAYFAANPGEFILPDELQARYNEALPKLEALGL